MISMATPQQQLPHQGSRSWLRQVIAQHPVASFLIMVYAVNIGVAFPPALTRRDLLPFDQAPYDWLGHILGSAVPAFVVTWALSGRAGVRDLTGRCLRWRVGLRWYAAALLAIPVETFLLASVFYGTEPGSLLVQKWALFFTTLIPHLLLVILFSNVAEEIGWTGFFLDRMQERFNPMKAAFITSVPFALFHVPGYVVEEGVAAAPILLGVLFIPQLASRFLVAWLYNNTKKRTAGRAVPLRFKRDGDNVLGPVPAGDQRSRVPLHIRHRHDRCDHRSHGDQRPIGLREQGIRSVDPIDRLINLVTFVWSSVKWDHEGPGSRLVGRVHRRARPCPVLRDHGICGLAATPNHRRHRATRASREYYDLTTDPWQLENIFQSLPPDQQASLGSQLAQARVCAGSECP